MGDRPNILQIENLLDLVEYALKDSLEIESMVWDSWSPMKIPINDSFLESSDDFLQQVQIINYRTNHYQSRVV
tara:strand:- start:20 stop:238 length:219 start_codon:yes stop_codon:yes gene_type:complete